MQGILHQQYLRGYIFGGGIVEASGLRGLRRGEFNTFAEAMVRVTSNTSIPLNEPYSSPLYIPYINALQRSLDYSSCDFARP